MRDVGEWPPPPSRHPEGTRPGAERGSKSTVPMRCERRAWAAGRAATRGSPYNVVFTRMYLRATSWRRRGAPMLHSGSFSRQMDEARSLPMDNSELAVRAQPAGRGPRPDYPVYRTELTPVSFLERSAAVFPEAV